ILAKSVRGVETISTIYQSISQIVTNEAGVTRGIPRPVRRRKTGPDSPPSREYRPFSGKKKG
ncbi:hypothetical protein, partial [Cryobacterium sp. TMT2-23]|uniref:hypothetical protein n=1 Tax=Cryobacterium sp. TMT2-23 TaxID=1259252 RepID=UPI001A7E9169